MTKNVEKIHVKNSYFPPNRFASVSTENCKGESIAPGAQPEELPSSLLIFILGP